MLKFITILSFLQAATAADLMPVQGGEAEQFQSSTFIKLMDILNDGKVPYPFEKLLDSFETGVREEGAVLMIPKGRSLVKEYADFKNPRIIAAPLSKGIIFGEVRNDESGNPVPNPHAAKEPDWEKKLEDYQKMGMFSSDLYIGFAPEHKALEVISYNPKKPGFDFFVVENYEEGKIPKVVSNPALCLGCHQNEAPIFSRFPWTEMSGEKSREKIDFMKDENPIIERIIKANPDRHSIEGITLDPKRFKISSVALFDTLVRSSNIQITDLKSCEVLCGKNSDIECKQALLLESLTTKNFRRHKFFKNTLSDLEKIDLKSSMIPNRDPDTNEATRDILTAAEVARTLEMRKKTDPNAFDEVADIYGKKNKYDVTYSESVFDTDGKAEIVQDKKFVDPATARPVNSNILSLKNKIKAAKTFNEKMELIVNNCLPLEQLKKDVPEEKINAEFFKNKDIVEALKDWPSTNQLLIAIAKALLSPDQTPPAPVCEEKVKPILPVYKYESLKEAVVKLSIEKIEKPKALFQKYCNQCHGPEGFIKLPLSSMEKMAAYAPTFSSMAPLERLQKKIMPPPFANQPTKEERDLMIKTMLELKK